MARITATLAGRIGFLFLGLTLVLQIITLSVTSALIFYPVAKNSVNDFAALIIFSAQTSVALPAEQFEHFRSELRRIHRIDINPSTHESDDETSYLPYVILLENALTNHLGMPVNVRAVKGEKNRYRVDFPLSGREVRIEFSRDRIGTSPILAMLIVAGGTLALSVVSALWLTNLIKRRFTIFTAATDDLARGARPDPIPEEGPEELVTLANNFNHMAQRVHELLDNRTTMLAGVSHDLRTPIARMVMALELLRESRDPALIERISRYLDDMNGLIGQFLQFARAQQPAVSEQTDLAKLLDQWSREYCDAASPVTRSGLSECSIQLSVLDFKRIVSNLVDNAIHYSASQPVEIWLGSEDNNIAVEIRDRGPGIPDEKKTLVFRPFYRLDASRQPDQSGTGLGLAIALEISRIHKWEIRLLNRENGGTTAQIIIPKPV